MLALSACDATGGLPSLAGLDLAGAATASKSDTSRRALSQVDMASGAITLRPPEGYCIDRRSLRRTGTSDFAMMARCDSLGVKGYYDAFDLAVITVTTAPAGTAADAPPTVEDVARSAGAGKVLDTITRDGVPLVRMSTRPARFAGVSEEHWRGAFVLNGQLVGLGLYAPSDSGSLGKMGAATLGALVGRTRRASTE